MPTYGVTGHMNLTADTVALVADALRRELADEPADRLVGVSCLAQGADALFARIVIDLGGRLQVILPSQDYQEAKVKPHYRAEFEALLAQATDVRTMPFHKANRDAYVAANEALVGQSDVLFAVWDGRPSDGKGGTADVVAYARERGTPVRVIWPRGAARESG